MCFLVLERRFGGSLRVLVTGGAGFIGCHTVDRLLAEGFDVAALDSLRSGRLENIKQHVNKRNFRFIRGDVRDSRLVRDLVSDVDAIIHLAALVSVPESIKNPALTYEINVNGTLNLLKASVDFGIKRFVYASSCAVYGDAENLPLREDYPPKPLSPYASSKLTAEGYVQKYNRSFGLETVCLRYFNVYGPRQICSDYSGVITRFINRLINGLPLVIFGDGEQTRDFVYVTYVAEANILALEHAKATGEIFNIGTGVATTINQLADMLLELTGKRNLGTVHSEPREGDVRYSVADVSKVKERLGFVPKVSLKDGFKRLLRQV